MPLRGPSPDNRVHSIALPKTHGVSSYDKQQRRFELFLLHANPFPFLFRGLTVKRVSTMRCIRPKCNPFFSKNSRDNLGPLTANLHVPFKANIGRMCGQRPRLGLKFQNAAGVDSRLSKRETHEQMALMNHWSRTIQVLGLRPEAPVHDHRFNRPIQHLNMVTDSRSDEQGFELQASIRMDLWRKVQPFYETLTQPNRMFGKTHFLLLPRE